MNGYEQSLNACIDALQARNDTLTVKLGYALESIRQLVQLAEENELGAEACVRVARYFLADKEGAK